MKVFVTSPAKKALKEICDRYRRIDYESYAIKIRKLILAKARSLSEYPNRGQEEELLKELGHGHRYLLVESHFKIIYIVKGKMVVVTDIFDTHQEPDEMSKRNQ